MNNNQQPKYGLNLSGIIRVFRKDRQVNSKNGTFNVTDVWFNASRKDQNGNYENVSANLFFPRNIEPPMNNSVIEIIEASPMVNGKGEYKRIVYYVKGWHYAQGYQQPQQNQQQGGQAPPPQQGQQPQQGGMNHGGQNYQQAPPPQQGGQYQQQPNYNNSQY